jgi:EAL domain-containing protein (putative c-di-GMP-specific phosphodiesterase class I)
MREHSMTVPGFTLAFQPIIRWDSREVFAQEALLRGLQHEPAQHVLASVPVTERYVFDMRVRERAILMAAQLGIQTRLALNCLPGGLVVPGALEGVVTTARRSGLSADRIIVEITETEAIGNHTRFARLVREYRQIGIQFAIDDFGAGHANLGLLADFQPDIVKLDMSLVHGIARCHARQSIVRGIVRVCRDLNIALVAEGVEAAAELGWLHQAGIELFQGHYLGLPSVERLGAGSFPAPAGRTVPVS